MRHKVREVVESRGFETAIIAVIVINAIVIGLETVPSVMAEYGSLLRAIDRIAIGVFIAEIVLKLFAYRLRFFASGWNVFDLAIVTAALVPASAGASVLRALRILRALRLISVVPKMRQVVAGLLSAIPSMGTVIVLLMLVFYVGAVMATKLYGPSFPEWFGSIPRSLYSLFQIMTLESWSMGIVRPVMEVHPLAWLFFVVFILTTTFAVLNLFIAIVVDAMNTSDHAEQEETRELVVTEHELVMAELKALRTELAELRAERGGAAPASGDQALASRL